MRITGTTGGVWGVNQERMKNGSKNGLMMLSWLETFHAVSVPYSWFCSKSLRQYLQH